MQRAVCDSFCGFLLLTRRLLYPFLPWCGKQKKMNSPESWYGQETLKKGL
ncbi:hypothetical protein [Blautia sp.]